jgi:hypothetical protein
VENKFVNGNWRYIGYAYFIFFCLGFQGFLKVDVALWYKSTAAQNIPGENISGAKYK